MKNAAERQKYRQRTFLRKLTDTTGRARSDLWQKGIEHVKRMQIAAGVPRATRVAEGELAPAAIGFVGALWTQIGPAPLTIDAQQQFQGIGPDSGEVIDIAIDPQGSTDQTIYIATNDGGVWKSLDGGTTWTPKTDFMKSLSMGTVALDPSNSSIVYAGTGNLFDGGRVFTKGIGIYKSIDAGETWSIVGDSVFQGKGINRIALPTTNVLLVATDNGLFRSVDGGQNFGANAPAFDDKAAITSGNCTDLHLDTASSSTVYVAIEGLGIFKSTDGGATFPTNLFATLNTTLGTYGFVAFALSTMPDNQTMFASIEGNPSANPKVYAGLYKSTDGGGTWTLMPDAANRAAENGGGQFAYDQTLAVDPQDANRVYLGFQELYVSTDGGTNFGTPAISHNQVHWDHHALVFSPRTHWGSPPTRLYIGTDGGIATLANGASWSNLNAGIATTLFLGIDIGRGNATNNGYTYGGSQDTGTSEHRPEHSSNEWHLGIDGDGGRVVVDPNNPRKVFSFDDGEFIVTTDGGNTWTSPPPGTTRLPACPPPFSSASCATPLAVDPNDSNVVYAASGNQLFQSMDAGVTFNAVNTFPANVHSLATTKSNSNILWVGLDDGTVHLTSNALAVPSNWNPPSNQPGIPAGSHPVEGIAIDPSDTNTVVVVYSGFTGITPPTLTKHAFRTTDSGANWTDIGGTDGGDPDQNLPDLPLHSVGIDSSTTPQSIIVGSDAAVMRTVDNGASWQVLGVGLPTVDCTSLALDSNVTPSLLRVGTYGRSIFELTRPTGPRLAVISNLGFGTVAPGSNATHTVQTFNVGSADLTISSFQLTAGSADFQIVSPPSFPVTVSPGSELDFSISFQPSSGGIQKATFQINSDDPITPTQQLPASGASPGTAPTVTGINPTSGSAAGGTSVTITGTGFSGATGVSFGSAAATNFTVDSDTQITAVSPAANLSGAVDVTVTTSGGTSATSGADQFTYITTGAAPTVTSINPTSGPAAGGTSVTIVGSGFTGATGVSFGSTAASNFTVDSDTQITAVSPVANLSGAVDVTVTTPNGTSATSSADQFTYITAAAPTVTSINPPSGPADGGTSVTIMGTGFNGATGVSFGSTAAANFMVDSDTQITATSPAANLSGAVDVTVTTPNGASATSSADQFTYITGAAPTVTGINPTSGSAAGGDTVIIAGSGFTGATTVNFGSTAASSFNVDSDTQITATSPEANLSGAVDVTVTTPNGPSAASSADQFTYITTGAAPTVTAMNPVSGPADGGTSIIITGAGLTGATGVSFGSIAASNFTVDSDTQVTAVSPAANLSGAVDVTVTTPNGTSATSSADQFTYITAAAPTVTGINPTSGPEVGATSVTITGSGFTGFTGVGFGPTGSTSVTLDSDTQLTAVSPPGTGSVDVTVVTPNGTSATSIADQFTYIAASTAPIVTGINPTSGQAAGGDSVTITGSGFTGATDVSFGSTAASSFTVDSDTQITATSPEANLSGAVDVTVTTPNGTSATSSADQFIYM